MKKNNLIYWQGQNFGDALSPMLIEELSGTAVQYKSWDPSPINRIKRVISTVMRFRFSELNNILWPSEHSIIAVGSVIRWGNPKSQIWGSGFMNEDDPFGGGTVHAVRGRLTAQKLQEAGQQRCEVFGDPALLLPLWIPAGTKKKHKLGIIPHWKEVELFKNITDNQFNIIDLRSSEIHRIIGEICDCSHILSSSLHGLIVAHAYGIPALWVKAGDIDTDGFKFRDYFSSVNIPFYDGFQQLDKIFESEQASMSLFKDHADKANIQVDLEKIQDQLLKAFPVPLKGRYQNILNKPKSEKIV